MPNLLTLRWSELERRVNSLSAEVDEWSKRSKALPKADEDRFNNAHFTQILALKKIIEPLMAPQQQLLDAMKAGTDSAVFTNNALQLMKRVILAQRFWDFFRDKLDLRFSKRFAEPLWIADTVAFDCYSTVISAAVAAGILPEGSFREPPLTYLMTEFSPLTWLRFQMPMQNGAPVFADGSLTLPFAVIGLPWDQIENLWELMALHHETGHDLERDLGLEKPFQTSFANGLSAAGIPDARTRVWQKWRKEIFADLVALQLGGPAFAVSLSSLILLPAELVFRYNPSDPHPTHYLRILLCAHYVESLGGGSVSLSGNARLDRIMDDASSIKTNWLAVYREAPSADLAAFFGDFDVVITALMDTPVAELKNRTVRSLMPYDEQVDNNIRGAASYISGGPNPPGPIRPRHIISAAHIAASTTTAAALDVSELANSLSTINDRIASLTRKNDTFGLRAGGAAAERKARWQEVVSDLLNQPLQFQGTTL